MTAGVIGIPSTDHGRWSAFRPCLEQLIRPDGVVVKECHGAAEPENRHRIVEWALAQGADWIFWLDDDLLFRPDALVKTLASQARSGADVLIGLSLQRNPVEGQYRPLWSTAGPESGRLWQPIEAIETGPHGLMRIAAGTNGGMLVQRRVYEAIGAPYSRKLPDDPFQPSTDIDLCWRATRAGLSVWGDPAIRYGHITHLALWPHQTPAGDWQTVIARGFEPIVVQPWAVPVGA